MEQIGRYRILKRLGGGGFGEVFLGEDPLIGRLVAIKLFRPKDENLIAFATSSDEEGLAILRARFLREAKILAELEDEPHVVGVLEFGELPEGDPWYAMPYLPRSLAEEIGRDVFDARALAELPEADHPRALPVEQALVVIAQILEGLAAAHRKGLVHRDVKPANILLSEGGAVRVADFGIAKAPDGQHSTVSHMGLGSRNYMAPEQRESAKHVDARADVYALGVVAYRVLTGRLPLGRYADPEVHAPSIGAGVNRVILKALETEPDARFADAGEMLSAFRDGMAQVGTPADNATGTHVTLAGGATPGVRSELTPLVARIESVLFEHGEVPAAAREALEPLAAIGDLDAAGLDALIAQVAEQHEAKLRPLRNFLVTIQEQVKARQGALSTADREALHEAGDSLGWAPSKVDAAIRRSHHALEEDKPAGITPEPAVIRERQSLPTAPSRQRSHSPARPRRWPRLALLGLIIVTTGAALWWWPSVDFSPASQITTRSAGETAAPREARSGRSSTVLGGGSGLLVVRTEPEGANVRIDGEDLGTTPLDLSELRAGTYTVELDDPRFRVERVERQTIADHRVTRIDKTLTPASGSVTVLSEPSGAWVERDGERAAEETPVTLEGLAVGRHKLRLGADEHHPREVEIEVTRGEVTVTDPIALDPIAYGTLTLDLEPSNAEVVLPDIGPRYRRGMRLEEGEYTVEVSARHHESRTLQLAVSGDTVERVALKPYGSLTLTIVPEDAEVRLPGIRSGYSPGMRLPDGSYQVGLSAEGHEPRTATVRVQGTTRERIELAQRYGTLTVEADPADAKVTLPESDIPYSPEVQVPEGRYQVRVEREGHHTRQVESHVVGSKRVVVRLSKIRHPGEEFTDRLRSGGEGPKMVAIPAGEFLMGSPSSEADRMDREGPERTVRIGQPFALGRTPVTFAEYDRFAEETGRSLPRPGGWVSGWGRGERPVVAVDWNDAKAYVEWLSVETGERYRLPSEAEWEYAARAGTTTSRWWGDDISCEQATYRDTSRSTFFSLNRQYCAGGPQTVPVGRFGPNPFGLYDVLGNVWEWTEDCWNESYNGAPLDGSAWTRGDCDHRVLRGGSWDNGPEWVRSAARGRNTAQYHINIFNARAGFRIARDL